MEQAPKLLDEVRNRIRRKQYIRVQRTKSCKCCCNLNNNLLARRLE